MLGPPASTRRVKLVSGPQRPRPALRRSDAQTGLPHMQGFLPRAEAARAAPFPPSPCFLDSPHNRVPQTCRSATFFGGSERRGCVSFWGGVSGPHETWTVQSTCVCRRSGVEPDRQLPLRQKKMLTSDSTVEVVVSAGRPVLDATPDGKMHGHMIRMRTASSCLLPCTARVPPPLPPECDCARPPPNAAATSVEVEFVSEFADSQVIIFQRLPTPSLSMFGQPSGRLV